MQLVEWGPSTDWDKFNGLIPFIISCWLSVLGNFLFSGNTGFMPGSPVKSPIGKSSLQETSVGPGSALGEKGQILGQMEENIGERSEPSGCLGRGEGQRSLETCLWCRRSMIPDFGIMLWLFKCLHVDRFAVLLRVSRYFNITLLQFAKRFFKTRISSKQYKFLCETFRLSLGSKKSKKYAWDLLQKEQEAFKISSFSYTLLWLTTVTFTKLLT